MEKTTIVGPGRYDEAVRATPTRSFPLKQRAREVPTRLDAWTRENPVQAILVAAGLGFAIGKLLHMGFRKGKQTRESRRSKTGFARFLAGC